MIYNQIVTWTAFAILAMFYYIVANLRTFWCTFTHSAIFYPVSISVIFEYIPKYSLSTGAVPKEPLPYAAQTDCT